ncbi:CMP/dCMP kinase [Nematocida ausubeli]|uniref:(d)CMP kinase n=1 Tax=Nematocida ausubeli (strain ATCC PRA-371 / ERTm2) TaxID=1913371 RepID=A0A086J2V5_NEMA1|nr:cytidylate kinase [Nematocida ausubeli]KAI5132222.1 CMP/dCMP kinase [Nematocida ausubeli]KAI5135149.1 CMP/dCMP kinase [Nematocida ausubeli]KAI5147934.1 CMP/dCMP kinase [Nematocida ausubeli]KAI5162146.1 CMP/dCMP kinase [Nematocida ausubeli]KFG26473.1 cytidylate kinase [Nematocida ausubeli]
MEDTCSKRRFRIAIDGPAGAGKTTLAGILAKTLGFEHINTGMIYRALSYVLLNEFADASKEELERILSSKSAQLTETIQGFSPFIMKDQVVVNGADIIGELRTPRIDSIVGIISKYEIIRRRVKVIQKNLIDAHLQVVVEGRDIGSEIIPDAELKVYLEASVEERAIRREKERSKDQDGQNDQNLEEIEQEIKERDYLDSTREISPLVKPLDAVVVDNTSLTVEETVKKIQKIVAQRMRM